MPIATLSPNHKSFFARFGLPFPSLLATCYPNRSAGSAAFWTTSKQAGGSSAGISEAATTGQGRKGDSEKWAVPAA